MPDIIRHQKIANQYIIRYYIKHSGITRFKSEIIFENVEILEHPYTTGENAKCCNYFFLNTLTIVQTVKQKIVI